MFRQNQDMIRSNYICKSYDKSDKCEFEKQEINKEAKTDFSSESQIIKTEKSRSIVENESQVNSETDKISQETIKENFPFPTFLKDQLEILTEIVDAIEEGYKYIILESGVGKSAIAATLANIYESSFILSDNKKLQEKYHEEYDLINNDVNNKQWHQYRTDLGNLINVSVNNISDLKLLKLHFQYFILEANNWIHDDYSDYCNPSFDLKFNKFRNDLIASLKLELNELQEIFNEAWDEVKIPSYTLAKADAFKKLILAFDGKELNSFY